MPEDVLNNDVKGTVRDAGMRRERITLKDGRYLIYYTFDPFYSHDVGPDLEADPADSETAEENV